MYYLCGHQDVTHQSTNETMIPFFKNIFAASLIIALGFSMISCDLINQEVGAFYHSYASVGTSADTVQVGSTVDAVICIWNYGNELFDFREDVQENRVQFKVLLKGSEPDYESMWCPVGTGNIILNRSYTLSESGNFTFSVLQPDGKFQERVVVVE